jgi:hypothetical protein
MATSPLTPTTKERLAARLLDPVSVSDRDGREVKFSPVEWPDGRFSFGRVSRDGFALVLPSRLSDVFYENVAALKRALSNELNSFDRT